MSVDFSRQFSQSGGAPIEWEGVLLHRTLRVGAKRGDHFELSFVRFTEHPVQGLAVGSKDRNVQMECAGTKSHDFVLWTDTAPKHVAISVLKPVRKHAEIVIYNVWRDEKYGTTMYGLSAAAMQIVPHGQNEQIIRCSDGWLGPDFNDLVVLLRVVPAE